MECFEDLFVALFLLWDVCLFSNYLEMQVLVRISQRDLLSCDTVWPWT